MITILVAAVLAAIYFWLYVVFVRSDDLLLARVCAACGWMSVLVVFTGVLSRLS